jgi:hypothetical protein
MNFFDEKKRLSILDSTFSFILSSLLPLSLFHSERFLINNYFITAALSFLLILVCIRKAVASLYIKITSIDILFVAVLITSITSSIVNETSFNSTFNIKFIIYACLFLLMKDILNYKKTVVYFNISIIFTKLFFAVANINFQITRNHYK